MEFKILLGNEVDFGTFEAASPGAALIAAIEDSDPTRRYRVELLSNSETFGQAAGGKSDGSGNGGQPTQDWFFVYGNDIVGVYKSFDAQEEL